MKQEKTILFSRNTNFHFDTRLRKSVKVALDDGYHVIVLDWPRQALNLQQNDPFLRDYKRRFHLYRCNIKSSFGLGFKNSFNILLFNLWLLKRIVQLSQSVTIYYSCDLDTAIPTLLISLLLRRKCVYDIYDFYAHTRNFPAQIKKLFSGLEYFLAARYSKVVVCSTTRADLFTYHTKKIPLIIPNIPDLSVNDITLATSLAKERNGESFTIAYAGTLAASGRLLLEITQLISKQNIYSLEVCGNGPLEAYFSEMSESYANISYYGHLSPRDAIMMQAKASLLFATYDPSVEINKYAAPNKLYEAMVLGLPIIVCRGTDPASDVLKYECGSVIDYNADQFMSAVHNYRSNRVLYLNHSNNSKNAYLSNFQWKSVAEQIGNMLSSL